jgi:hypothetical protein
MLGQRDKIHRRAETYADTFTESAKNAAARPYLKLGLGGEHTDSNQRLMYTSA